MQLNSNPIEFSGVYNAPVKFLRSAVSLICLFCLFWVMASGVVVAGFFGFRYTLGWMFARKFGAWAMTISGVETSVRGLERLPEDQAFVLVANHQSHFDGIFLIGFLPIYLHVAAKQELFRLPLLGIAFRALGFIAVNRFHRRKAADSVSDGTVLLRQGGRLLIFPEGTRGSGETVRPFKTGAIRMALDAEVLVVPVGISGTERVLPVGSWSIRGNRIHLEVGDPISVAGHTHEDRHQLAQVARDAVALLKAQGEEFILSD